MATCLAGISICKKILSCNKRHLIVFGINRWKIATFKQLKSYLSREFLYRISSLAENRKKCTLAYEAYANNEACCWTHSETSEYYATSDVRKTCQVSKKNHKHNSRNVSNMATDRAAGGITYSLSLKNSFSVLLKFREYLTKSRLRTSSA